MDIYSLRSMCCEECSSLYIPPDLNKTSAMARYTPTQYSSDNKTSAKRLKRKGIVAKLRERQYLVYTIFSYLKLSRR